MFNYQFSAVKGIQANREYYIAMVPLGLLPKLFDSGEEYIQPEYRAQRCISETRVPEIRDYILNNRNSYVFSALSASIDGNFKFNPMKEDSNLGVLQVDMDAVFLINDGQHRKASIEAAIKEDESLKNETIAIVFFRDEGLKRSQQMFADLNKHAVKPSKSLSTLYDGRDSFSNVVKQVVSDVPFLSKYIDKEHDTLGKYSSKLFTLSNFLKANQRIIKEYTIDEEDKRFLVSFWNSLFTELQEWNQLEHKQIYKCVFKEEYVLTLSVILQVFGRLGHYFYTNHILVDNLKKLNEIDWTRSNPDWKGILINENGKIINSEKAIIDICNYLKNKIGLED